MIPAGYLLKRVKPPPDWLGTPNIIDVCSLSDCVNDNVVDLQAVWKHNAFGLANDPKTLCELADSDVHDLKGSTFFYYEAYAYEIESDGWEFDPKAWRPVTPVPSASVSTAVSPPTPPLKATVISYDVVTFGDVLEHSPMSYNSVAKDLPVNETCFLASLDAAKDAINAGAFGGGREEGVYKIFSVASVTSEPFDPASANI